MLPAHKLKPYFQAYTMVVLTDKPLQRAMSNPEAAGWMALWAIELSKFDVQYCSRSAIKGQGAKKHPQWSIHMNESSNRQTGGAGIVLHSLEADEIKCLVRLDFPTTNNETEYKALMAGLDLAKAIGATSVVVYCDFQVVISQVNGDYECKEKRMKKYLEYVRKQVGEFQAKFVQIPKYVRKQVGEKRMKKYYCLTMQKDAQAYVKAYDKCQKFSNAIR